ncbi:dynamin family protein [Lysobacter korlensis]|uniref:Dynamin family protein n=1 Tax=Lysobacter korlensis TaxID=553636 RepID=A0ABV6RN93_9GAMM
MTSATDTRPAGTVADLVEQAKEVYADDAEARAALASYARRLDEPLRVAIAGMVKAGKSTLLNAIIGEEIAPTDTGECTRVVTWYRYADTPRVTLRSVAGESRLLPIRRVDGRLALDLDGTRAEEVSRLVVDWPAKSLREVTLIDTPGIASLSHDVSARSHGFLTPEGGPSEADAIIYLMRHLHAADINFLESFRDAAVGQSGTVNAIAVLSRADEIGAGRIDSLVSARGIAARYRSDGALRKLALGVVPMAGLLAQSARTLREAEYAVLLELAALGRDEREALLVSVDRFIRPTPVLGSDPEARAQLLSRFGLFGIRLACVLLRTSVRDSTELAHELARRSGLGELLRLLDAQFHARAKDLKERTALVGVDALVRRRPRAGCERLAESIERIQASAHQFRELQLLATARTDGLGLPAELQAEAERLIGGEGVAAASRLGLPEDAAPEEIRAAGATSLRRWRTLAVNPLTDRATAEVCEVLVRSCEAAVARAAEGTPRSSLWLPIAAEPASGAGEQRDDRGDAREQQLSGEQHAQVEAGVAQRKERVGGHGDPRVREQEEQEHPADHTAPVHHQTQQQRLHHDDKDEAAHAGPVGNLGRPLKRALSLVGHQVGDQLLQLVQLRRPGKEGEADREEADDEARDPQGAGSGDRGRRRGGGLDRRG